MLYSVNWISNTNFVSRLKLHSVLIVKILIKVWLALVNVLYPLDKTINAPLLLCYVRHRNILALRTENHSE